MSQVDLVGFELSRKHKTLSHFNDFIVVDLDFLYKENIKGEEEE